MKNRQQVVKNYGNIKIFVWVFTYAHGTCFEYIWSANMTLVRRGSMNEHGKMLLIWDYFCHNPNLGLATKPRAY